jgi:hypothetical protein
MLNRLCSAILLFALLTPFATIAAAQDTSCERYEVDAATLNIRQRPSPSGTFKDLLQRGETVCITRKQTVGGAEWGYAETILLPDGRTAPIQGWAPLDELKAVGGGAVIEADAKPNGGGGTNGLDAEQAAWNEAFRTADPQKLRAYLTAYPKGAFARDAEILLRSLETTAATTAVPNAGGSSATDTTQRQSARKLQPARTEKPKPKRTVRRTTESEPRKRKPRVKKTVEKKQARQQARQSPRVSSKPRRKKNCRYETKIECMQRGGHVDDTLTCHVKWICP